MKRSKIFPLVLSLCIAVSAFAGCSKTEETSIESAESESPVETSAEESEVTEETSEAVETTETAVSSEVEYIELDESLQEYANIFVSNFAEQHLSDFNRDSATAEQLFDFVRIHLKINNREAVTYDNNGQIPYETFTFETAQSVVSRYFGILLSDISYDSLPTPPDSYGDEPVIGPYASDGMIWYQAADGECYNTFAVVDSAINNYDGTLTLLFTVYQIDPDTYFALDIDEIHAYYSLTPEEAAVDRTISAVTTGEAVVDVGQTGEYYLISYSTNS